MYSCYCRIARTTRCCFCMVFFCANLRATCYWNKILTSGIAELQLQDKKLWVRYNDERVFLPENILGLLRVFNVDNAYEIIVEENDDVSSSSKEKGKEKEMEIKESNIEVKRIKNAFHINYQGSALDTFYERLVLFHDEWRAGNKSYAPYLTTFI
ncbi:hypothetical protein GLOIN_2v279562 [Rhizophagus irregularis DAOM 181602=DAOM 197198]|nr:hypothetical protein GLOIN_2v279562 [Rhizophagus irregularis DAOM 181602=DAOM 197198]